MLFRSENHWATEALQHQRDSRGRSDLVEADAGDRRERHRHNDHADTDACDHDRHDQVREVRHLAVERRPVDHGADHQGSTGDDDDPRLVVLPRQGPCVAQGVEGRIVQVLRNLIGNAQSFSPANGRIRLSARDAGTMVEISVEDEGPGIPDAKLEHIFDRFYSERPQNERFGQHSGLGLSISRQIVEALKGRISAENRRDATGRVIGARFLVRLPKAA